MPAIKNLSIYFFSACIAFLSTAELREHFFKENESKIAASAEQHFQELEKQMQQSLETILNFKTEEEFHKYFIHGKLQKSGFSFLYFEKGKLIRWSDDEQQIPDSLPLNSLIHLSDGWYETFSKEVSDKKTIGLLLVKKEYPFENNYLQNH